MEYAISQLSYLPETRDQQARFVEMAKQEILNGVFDAKELLFRKKIIEDTLDQIFKDEDVKKHLMSEIEKYGKGGAGYEGAKIEIGGKKEYDYSKCNDSEMNDLILKQEEIKKKVAERAKFLQTLQKPVANPDTGELIYPAAYTQTDYFKVSFPKK